jgi:hypothetical protein
LETSTLQTTDLTSSEAEVAVEAAPIPGGLPRIDRALLFTFEFDDKEVRWTATPTRQRKNAPCQQGLLEFGYNDLEKLEEWFAALRDRLGKRKHECHIHISGPEILRRSFLVPVVPKAELEAVVRSQARQNFPFDIDRGLFGWKIVDELEWAGGPKYQIYAQALDEHWHLWLGKLFGDWLAQVSFIGASGQHLEHLLRHNYTDFKSEDSYLIRLRGALLETGFYHHGHLEFFREVPVESLADNQTVAELTAALGEIAQASELERSLQINDIRIIISDALDYYYGLHGQRQIKTIYLSVPTEFQEAAQQFAAEVADCQVVNLCAESEIDKHRALSGLAAVPEDYQVWMSVLPKRQLSPTLVNLLPPQLQRRRRDTRVFVRAILGLLLLVAVMGTMSGLKYLSSEMLAEKLSMRKVDIIEMEQHPILAQLGAYRAQISLLTATLEGYVKAPSDEYLAALKLISQQSRANLYLNSLQLARRAETPGVVLSFSGEIVGPNERQQSELFTYLANLNGQPLVESALVQGTQIERQLGREKLKFDMEVVARQ